MNVVESFPHTVRNIEHLWIPMSDGARLAARVWLPEGAEESPVPALLEYIPYRKRDLTRQRDSINHPYLAGHGYATVRVDLRGSGESDGVLKDEYLEQEQLDGVEVIRWIAQQPWCDGSVGMFGISWGGFNALQIAARRPPELKAIITACSTDDLYVDNMHYMGGCMLSDNLSEATTMFAFNSCPPDPALVGERWREMWLERLEESGLWLDVWLRHQHRDYFWRPGSISEDYSAITCPVMATSGWADGFSNAVFRMLEHLDVPRKGLIGPWSHKYPHMGVPGPAIGFLQEMLRWWDKWLKGIETGVMDGPMLRVWMQDSVPPTTSYQVRPGRWVGESSWPTPHIEERRYPLGLRRIVMDEAEDVPETAMRIQSPLSVGLFAGKWCSYAATPDLPHDQREENGGSLVFDSVRLPEPIEILGSPVAELDLCADQPVAMVAVRLSDVHPDGETTRITYGVLNLTHRNGHEHPEPLEPGKRYRVRVLLNGIAQAFPAGHRLEVAVSTSYWPLTWTPPKPATLTIFGGSSALHLPVREPREEDAHLPPFAEPEGAPPIEQRDLEPVHHNWWVVRDLAKDESTLEVVKDQGVNRIEEIDMEIEQRTYEWYSSRNHDFGSIRGETRTIRGFRRGDWHTRARTRTVLTSNETHFHLRAEVDAYEGEHRIYSQNWDRTIPRNLL